MKITEEKLLELGATCDELDWFVKQNETDLRTLYELAKKDDMLHHGFWFIPKVMTKRQCTRLAVFAANLVLHIFEEAYPDDDRPRKTIEAAKVCLDNPSAANMAAAYAAANAAAYAADAADASYATTIDAANAAANAAYAAAYAAYAAANAAAYAAYAAAYAADAAAASYVAYAADAADAADASYATTIDAADAKKEIQIKILDFGLKLLGE